MDPATGAALISAGSNLLGKVIGGGSDKSGLYKQYDLNKTTLLNQLQWRVADAKKAGIHPLAAIGVQPAGFNPTYIGGDTSSSAGQIVSDMGQDISRAVGAYGSREERAVTNTMQALQLERAGLENELLRSQINASNRAVSPSMPVPGVVPYPAGDFRPHTTPEGSEVTAPQGETLDMTTEMNPYGMAYMLRDLLGRVSKVWKAGAEYSRLEGKVGSDQAGRFRDKYFNPFYKDGR